MKSIISLSGLLLVASAAVATIGFTSCDNDDFSTEQYVGGVHLNSFGPSPVARGGELRFLGSGMDQITKISIPGCDDISDIEVINSGEIRCKVPQTAEPGHVTLHYSGGSIETKSLLSYLEPISIESITPARVKPGQELTISGEYLNLIKEVCFAFQTDSVNVYAGSFTEHNRQTIKLTVPEEAISGTIYISDAKEMPNMIESEAVIDVVLPSVATPVDLTNAKQGQQVRIEGSDLDLVRKMEMPDGSALEFTYDNADGKEALLFTLPDNSTDGAVVAIPASGVKVAVANIGMVVPTELVAEPADGIRPGDIVTIKGVNMDQVVSLLFPNVEEAVEPASVEATKITVAFPEAAQSGEVTLNLKSGKTVAIELQTAKPEVTGFNPNPVSAAAEFTIAGKNLDLVTAITFTGDVAGELPEGITADAITLLAPATAKSGPLTLTMANGESVTTEALEITAPECAFITSVDTQEPTAGELLVVNLLNGDKLTGVEVNGQTVQYILNGEKLYINLPSSCGAASKVRLISSNGEITYTYDVIPATHVEKVIFNEVFSLGNWDAGGLRLYKDAFQGIPAGALLVFHVATDADAQIQLNDANWGQFAMIDVPAGATRAEYALTAENLNQILTTADGWSETAIVVNGHTAVISKVTLEYEQSLETAIWEGSWESGNWQGNQDLAWGGYDWASAKTGSIVRIYVTPTVADPASDWWCVAVRHGDGWNTLPAPVPDQWGQPVSGVVEFTLDANVKQDLVDNGGLVITGADYILTKVTIE